MLKKAKGVSLLRVAGWVLIVKKRILYHYPLSPFSRKVRIALREKELSFEPKIENFWERRREFLIMNPAAQVPVLIEAGGDLFSDSTAVCEYLEEKYPERNLLGDTAEERAEVRRLAGWFNNKFYYEVTKYVLDEKMFKYLRGEGEPCTVSLRAAESNVLAHLDYIGYLCQQRTWLAGEKFSMADIAAASHISVLDYLGYIPWRHNEQVKEWYALVKSRPSFRPLLKDRVAGFQPPRHYNDLDF